MLHFESVAGECQIWVNGRRVGEHFDKYWPFDLDVNRTILRCGVSGEFAKGGRVLLTASRTDGSLFNRRAEEEKVGAVFCYEKLLKPDGAALVARAVGGGTLAICTVDASVDSPARRKFWGMLFANMGVKTQPLSPETEKGRKAAHDLLQAGPKN